MVPFSKSVIAPTLDFDPSGTLLGVGSIPPTTGRSVSGIFPKGFRLWTESGPQSVAVSSPSSPGAITPFSLRITQLSSLSSAKLLSRSMPTEY